ncbi:MAG: FAD-binding oxidoreductase [Acidobacteria bacterium]|nr:MAG: FAD-binding oxidoreductase [Acidobacteriota bacterium]
MQVKTQHDGLENYLTDASNMPGGHAEKLFVPESADDIAQILREANASGTPVTISGARTGTVGGAVPFGGYVISLERMNKIKSIDRETMTAIVEPGVILGDFQKAVEAEGLFYPPDPTEWSCQIGGTVATNASGARSFKYGATRGFVKVLTVVLAHGRELKISRGEAISTDGQSIEFSGICIKLPTYERPNVRKNVSGFYNARPLDAIDLFIGSEGTLGVITEIELSLLPKREGLFSGIVFFEREGDLLGFVNEVRELSFDNRNAAVPAAVAEASRRRGKAGRLPDSQRDAGATLDATLLEYFDAQALKFISGKFPETPDGMAGAIFFEQETTSENDDELFEAWNALLEKHNADLDRSWFTTNEQDREKMREFRHALPVSVNEFITKHKQKKVGTDMAVPDNKFPGFLKFYKDTLDASGIDYVIFGHIGDCHLHANLLPKNDAEAERARHIYGRCIAQAIMLGGCVSAEHGIGKLKAKYLNVMMGERYLNEMIELKRVFDPKGILGRGNMFG